jgi:predicted amidohydrolase
LKVTLLQTDIRWAQPEENIRCAEQLLSNAEESDLYVLPEMWSTGFATKPHGIAADEDANSAFVWMKETAARRQCAIAGSLAVRLLDGSFRNRHYFIDGRKGNVYYYDKHHLFTYGHEDEYYTAGQEHTVVMYGDFRFLLLTCYDLRFPCWSRYADTLEYDAIILVANWPESRQSAWQLLTRSRAIENQCYLVGCNRVGDDQHSHYAGCSVIVDAYGKALAQCHKNRAESLTINIDIAELQRRRSKFRVLEDRD